VGPSKGENGDAKLSKSANDDVPSSGISGDMKSWAVSDGEDTDDSGEGVNAGRADPEFEVDAIESDSSSRTRSSSNNNFSLSFWVRLFCFLSSYSHSSDLFIFVHCRQTGLAPSHFWLVV
jgi:hypothetical protein